jgi:hypothetical protein
VALIALVLGFRHAMRLPADLRANWVFHVAWLGDAKHFASGVKRFGVVGVVLPTVLLLAPIYVVLLGVERAAAHTVLGFVFGTLLLQLSMLDAERLPLACAYAPSSTLKTRGPVYLFAGIAIVYWIGWFERAALASSEGVAIFAVVGLASYAGLGFIASHQADSRIPGDVEPSLEEPTQRLGLNA